MAYRLVPSSAMLPNLINHLTVFHTVLSTRSRKRNFLSIYHHVKGVFLIAGLLERSRPSAITWPISFVHIDAIKGMFRRRFGAHVGQEVFKLIPTRINRYASINVRIFWLGIETSTPHRFPCCVLRRSFCTMRAFCLSTLHPITPAGFTAALKHGSEGLHACLSA